MREKEKERARAKTSVQKSLGKKTERAREMEYRSSRFKGGCGKGVIEAVRRKARGRSGEATDEKELEWRRKI